MVQVSLIVIIFNAILLIGLANGVRKGKFAFLRDMLGKGITDQNIQKICEDLNMVSIDEDGTDHSPQDSFDTGADADSDRAVMIEMCNMAKTSMSNAKDFLRKRLPAGSSNVPDFPFIVNILGCNGVLITFGNDAESDTVITTHECADKIKSEMQEGVYAMFPHRHPILITAVVSAPTTGLGHITLAEFSNHPILVQHNDDHPNTGEYGTAACLLGQNGAYIEDKKEAQVVSLGSNVNSATQRVIQVVPPTPFSHPLGSPYFNQGQGALTLRGLNLGTMTGDRHEYLYVDQQGVFGALTEHKKQMEKEKRKGKAVRVYGSPSDTGGGLKMKD